MTTDEAIQQAISKIESVVQAQAANIAWCMVQQLRPSWPTQRISIEVEPLQLEIERILQA